MDDCEQCVPCGCCLFLVVVVLMGAFYTANKTPPSRLSIDDNDHFREVRQPVDCQVDYWGSWTSCSATCGIGTHQRNRGIIRYASYGGSSCPATWESKKCELRPCPRNCQVNDWTSWSDCSKSCGTGTRQRSREVIQQNDYNGKGCLELDEEIECNDRECPVHCEVGQWSNWSDCSTSCGLGSRHRTRLVIKENKYDGNECPSLKETADCNTGECPVNCLVGDWTTWNECSKSCGTGTRQRSREVIQQNDYNGKDCPELDEEIECNERECPVHCEVGQWSNWSDCSTSCGLGSRHRTRLVIKENKYDGNECPSLKETADCNTGECPVNCLRTCRLAIGRLGMNAASHAEQEHVRGQERSSNKMITMEKTVPSWMRKLNALSVNVQCIVRRDLGKRGRNARSVVEGGKGQDTVTSSRKLITTEKHVFQCIMKTATKRIVQNQLINGYLLLLD
ncbi:spondin-1-like isoform X5 [Clavelina lepadiformis]|uniref:spondin-1-like isoform X5 n=2 Tax=Clavelina lepadiformis TaxID=159417 RepID=UPI004041C03E